MKLMSQKIWREKWEERSSNIIKANKILEGMVYGQNWEGGQKMTYEEQIIKDTECKFFLRWKNLHMKEESG